MTDPPRDDAPTPTPAPAPAETRAARRWLVVGLWLAVIVAAAWVALLARQVVIDARPADPPGRGSDPAATEPPPLAPPALPLESTDRAPRVEDWLAGSLPGEPLDGVPADLVLPDDAEPLFRRRFTHGGATEEVMVATFARADPDALANQLTEAAKGAGFRPARGEASAPERGVWSARFTDDRQRALRLHLRLIEEAGEIRAVIRLIF